MLRLFRLFPVSASSTQQHQHIHFLDLFVIVTNYIHNINELVVHKLVATLHLWLAPETSRNVEEILYQQSHTTEFDSIVAGRFQGNIERQVIYAETMSDDRQQLLNVFVFNRPTATASPALIKATSARHIFDETYPELNLFLKQGSRTECEP
mgnify:CR=1 FL=1